MYESCPVQMFWLATKLISISFHTWYHLQKKICKSQFFSSKFQCSRNWTGIWHFYSAVQFCYSVVEFYYSILTNAFCLCNEMNTQKTWPELSLNLQIIHFPWKRRNFEKHVKFWVIYLAPLRWVSFSSWCLCHLNIVRVWFE